MKTEKIQTNGQVRKDLGDLTELKASIQEKGILQPLLVDKDNLLIAGHRRLQAAKEIGITEVPVHVIDTTKEGSVMEIQLIENIQRKDLDPIEESQAYGDYLNKNNATIPQLAKAIGKTADYVKRRVNLKELTPEVEKALQNKKIELGHALLLNQMTKVMQKESLEFIQEYDLTVQNFADQIRWMGIDFMDIQFRPEESDGSKQKTLLDDIGIETNPKNEVADTLKNNNKFKAELGAYIESQRKILKKKGITVFNSRNELIKKHPGAYEVHAWETEQYNKIVKKLPNNTNYAVTIDISNWGDIEKEVYCLIPEAEQKAVQKEANKETTEENRAEADKMLELNREERLQEKVKIYKHDFLVERAPSILKLNTKAQRVVTIGQLAAQIGWGVNANIYGREAMKILGIKDFNQVKKILACTPKKLDEAIMALNKAYLSSYQNAELEMLMTAEGFKYDKETVITKEFLELHSKDQLITLAKELKMEESFIEASKHAKKGELIDEFLDYELEGMVPKVVRKSK